MKHEELQHLNVRWRRKYRAKRVERAASGRQVLCQSSLGDRGLDQAERSAALFPAGLLRAFNTYPCNVPPRQEDVGVAVLGLI